MSSTTDPKLRETLRRASARRFVPTKSKVKEVRDTDSLSDTVTLELDMTKPVSFIEDPEDVIPHEQIPEKIRQAIVETYGEKFFRQKDWTRLKLTQLARAITHPRENITHAIAQICGPNCTVKDTCPYDIAGRPPIGERCPIEIRLGEQFYQAYVGAVSERLKMDPEEIQQDIILHNLVNGLVESDMVEMRLNGSIAEDGFFSEVPAVVNETTGEVFTRQEESVAVRIKERVARRKDQLYRQLLATPEMAEKYKRKGEADNVARSAKLLDRMEKVIGELEHKPIKDGELSD